jgi:hypothetical protein
MSHSTFKFIAFNVAQGDNLLLEFPRNKDGYLEFGLVDFHYDSDINLNEPPSITFLKNEVLRIEEKIVLAFVHFSHFHFDHIKGMSILNNLLEDEDYKDRIIFNQLWIPSGIDHSMIFDLIDSNNILRHKVISNKDLDGDIKRDFFEEIKSIRKLKERVKSKNVIPIFEFLREQYYKNKIEVFSIAPGRKGVVKQTQNELLEFIIKLLKVKSIKNDSIDRNLLSSILKANNGIFQVSLGGDACLSSWNESLNFLKKNKIDINIKSHIFKVSHHGSSYSSSKNLWKKLLDNSKETFIVFSAGIDYDHPHKKTIDHINNTRHPKLNFYTTNSHPDVSIGRNVERGIVWKLPELKSSPNNDIITRVNTTVVSDGYSPNNLQSSVITKVHGLIGYEFVISDKVDVLKIVAK